MSLMGYLRYYERFVPGLAHMAAPLTKLLKKEYEKKIEQVWGEDQDRAVQLIKDDLERGRTIVGQVRIPDKPVLLQTDASDVAMGAVLSHYSFDEQGNRIEQPIVHASKCLNIHQKRYSTTEKEGLAVVWAVDLFKSMLIGKNFTVETDHSALRQLLTTKDPSGRLARWVLKLQQYDIDVLYRPGSKHINADFLSKRLTPEQIAEHSKTDLALRMLKIFKDTGTLMEFPRNFDKTQANEIREWIRQVAPKAVQQRDKSWYIEETIQKTPHVIDRVRRILLPHALTNEVIARMHGDNFGGHQSERRTISMVKEGYSWPGMGRHIKRFVRTCDKCQSFNLPHSSGEIGEHPTPEMPFRVVAMDHCGPFDSGKKRGYKHILVLVDVLTRYVILTPTRSTESTEVIQAIRDKLLPFAGIPTAIICDQASAFMGKKFRNFCDQIGAFIHPIPAGASSSNGLVERVNRSIQNHIRKLVKEDDWAKTWWKLCPLLEFILRTARRDDCNLSPSELLLGWRI
ncbi:unnamed protein product [Heterosigma akashiwo]